MAKRSWSDLSESTRRKIMAVAAVDGALKTVALVDLKRRDSAQVRGSKRAWGVALALVNSAGVLPIVYFFWGRKRAS